MYVAALRLRAARARAGGDRVRGCRSRVRDGARAPVPARAPRAARRRSRARGADAARALARRSDGIRSAGVVGIIIWLAACGAGAAFLIATPTHFARAASLGLAAGLLFADGDISAKLVGYGGLWLVALLTLIVAYAVGTSVLQSAYQRGDALTAAGTATMVTNAVPIAAGFVLFDETLPHGIRAVLQIAAFTALVASAVALGRQQAPRAKDPVSRRPDRQTPAERPADPR